MGEVAGVLIGGGVVGLSIAVIMAVLACVFFWYIIQAVGYWKVFKKAGEDGWKALVPFYGTYIRYKLTWNERMFWISAGLMAVGWVIPESGNFLISLVRLAVSVGYLVITIKAFYKVSLAFGHGVGFTVGLFFLEPVFALILGLDGSRYEGVQQ